MLSTWSLLTISLKLLFHLNTYVPTKGNPFPAEPKFRNISSYHDFAQLLLDHQKVKQEAYEFAKSKGWIRYPIKMKKELTQINYTAYPFLDELVKFHPDFVENEKKMKKYYYTNEKKCGNRRALRQFKLRYNREKYSIHPTDAGRTKKKNDRSEEVRNPVQNMKEKLIKMDRAIDYIDMQVLKKAMTTSADFLSLKERAEVIRKRIHAIEYNGTENYTPKPTKTLKTTVITVRPIKSNLLRGLMKHFPQYFVVVNITTPSSLERNTYN